jgi:hypothetical protein
MMKMASDEDWRYVRVLCGVLLIWNGVVRAQSDLKRTGVVRCCNERWMICCEKVF